MLYQLSWTILLAPIAAFVVIIFGTRPWDLLSRRRVGDPSTASAQHALSEKGSTGGDHGVSSAHAAAVHDDHGHGLDDDEDPKVAHLSTGAIASSYVAMLVMAFACVYSWALLVNTLFINPNALQKSQVVLNYPWLHVGSLDYSIVFQVDQLGIAMMVVVTTISLMVMVYSQGYMENSAGYARFYSYLSLFVFSMLVIVFSDNFLVIFCGWELVGLSSYLLIGFWINKRSRPLEQRPSPAEASLQSFVMTRIGDVGFLIGIMILFVSTGTFTFSDVVTRVQHMDPTLLGVAMVLVFCGAIGKSAQFPLHTWLPSAMEGPTPVSALIHAATMVAAGVYLVARTYPLFALAAPFALETVAVVGAFTAFFAATIALVQSDFKRVLAFSTISQLGYMFVGLGVSLPETGVGPGMFHLFTHAFFKALLFLGAGSVLIGLHHAMHKEVQDVRLMGGLATRMPITAATWLIAVLAISGFPGFSGFWSKEEIISLSWENGHPIIYVMTLVTAGLTAFYMLRAFILAFGGKGGKLGGLWGGPYRGEGEVHESPLTMTIPLSILAVFSVVAGYWSNFFSYVNVTGEHVQNLSFAVLLADPLTWLGVIVAFAGLGFAWFVYGRYELAKINQFVQASALLRTLHRILYNRYYIDTFYNWITQYVVLGISNIAQWIDANVIDGIVNGVARGVTEVGSDTRRVETGRVQSYMIGFFGGVAVLVIVALVLVSTVWK